MAILLAGCTVGPDYAPPHIALPLFWTSDRNAKPPELAAWWQQFNDPLLNELIERAVAGNVDVATAKANIRAARASYRASYGALLPQADGDVSAKRSGSKQTAASSFSTGISSSWEIDLFGSNRRAAEAAKYGLDAQEEELRATLLSLIGDVAQNYVELRGYQSRISLARRTAESQRNTADLTRSKFKAGAASAIDVEKALGSAASTAANISQLEAQASQSMHRLSVLLGQAPGALVRQLSHGGGIPTPKFPVKTGIPADVLTNRPDIRVAERQYAQANAKVGKAEADRYPSISLAGSIATSGTSLGALAKASTISWSFGPTISIPIFNGGQLSAAVDEARATRDVQFLNYRSTVLTALEEVENAIVSLAQDRNQMQQLSVAAGHYREAVSLSRSLYNSGTQSFFELLEADRTLYSTETSLIEAKVSIATDFISLNKALGGGWDGKIDTSTPEVTDINSVPVPTLIRNPS
ncbi:efflux transporter outer membrane subunit [Rhizobium sp. L1K21]|uniref:efflux transporter outer membrane subunit n=1 Tax=Rhizobium sp. L1K21 TaxID=2954933 RepID=UPI002093FD8C|nr:efflux transporter outer membrane subunit [Rhizobium sp. L1K21]